jgi:hypothetical protein
VSTLDDRGLPAGYPFNPDWEITQREYVRRRDAGELIVLLDCLTASERDIASITGANPSKRARVCYSNSRTW